MIDIRRSTGVFVSFCMSVSMLLSGCDIALNVSTGSDNAAKTENSSEAEEKTDTSVMRPWINSNIFGIVTDDVNANAKDDYYLYVTHDYLRDTKLLPGLPYNMIALEAEEIVKDRCMEIISDRSLSSRDAKLVQDYYDLFLDWDTRNRIGIEPLKPFVEELEKVKTLDDMTQFLLSDINLTYGVNIPSVSIGTDYDDSTRYNVEISPGPLSLGDPAEYFEITENGKRTMKLCEDRYSYILGRFGYSDDDIEKLISDKLEFEKKLAENQMTFYDQTGGDAIRKQINPVTMDDLKKLSSHYPLPEYMENTGYGRSELINLKEPAWLESLDKLYDDENLDGIKAYILIRSLAGNMNCLDEESYRMNVEINNASSGITDTMSDEDAAYADTLASFPDSLSRLYIERYLNDDIRREIRKLCQDSIDTYCEMLDEEDWLSDETREEAKNKLNHITINAVYPDKWKDDSMYSVTSKEDGGSYFQAVTDYKTATRKYNLTLINGTKDNQIWKENILEANAYYEPEDNSINIIPGFFSDVSYRSDMSVEEKYGALGGVIGHEISHAFDTEGSQYDEKGNLRNWWTDEDREAFSKRADKLISFYDNVVAFDDKTPYYGQVVQCEAIADMAGLKCMLKMAEKIDGFDYDKFFRAFARMNAGVETESMAKSAAKYDVHPLPYLRGNVTVQQFDEFMETYGVKEGDGMYLAKEDRISVW